MKPAGPVIGVLALQGEVPEHPRALESASARPTQVRRPNELDCLDKRTTPDSVGMGSYTLDSHNVRRYVTPEGNVQNEGDIGVATRGPYGIAYG